MASGKRHIPALVLAASLTLPGAGCGSGGTSTAAWPKAGHLEKTTLNVAVLPDIDSAGFFVALHEGLFAREGLTVDYSPAPGSEVIAGQVKGQYDITGGNYVSYIEAQASHQADLRIVAEGSLLEPGTGLRSDRRRDHRRAAGQPDGRTVRRGRPRRPGSGRHPAVPDGGLRGDQRLGEGQPGHAPGADTGAELGARVAPGSAAAWWSEQDERAGVVGVGLRVRQVAPGSAVRRQVAPGRNARYLAAPGHGGHRQDRDRERGRDAGEKRQGQQYAVDHLRSPIMMAFTVLTNKSMERVS